MNNIKRYFITAVLSGLGLMAFAQGEYDAFNYSQDDLLGTARYMSMAGAFGALGGDMSAVSQNPGGIGIYRSSEFSLTPVIGYSSSSADYNGISRKENKLTAGFNSIGYIGSFRPSNTENINNINFGVSYTKTKDFNRNMFISGKNNASSLLDGICADNANVPTMSLSGLGNLAYNAYLTNYAGGVYTSVLRQNELVDKTMYMNEDGHSGVFDFSLGANWGHFMYIGVGVGLNLMDYSMTSSYSEHSLGVIEGTTEIQPFEYELRNALSTTGSGVNFKIGAILKPFPFLRFGFALHTPTYYKLTDVFGASMTSDLMPANTQSESAESDLTYQLQTPGKIMYSAAYLFGQRAILSFDCDVVDYREMALKYENGMPCDETNASIDDHFKTAYNVRVGAEYRVNDNFSVRGGFASYDQGYQKNRASANTFVSTVGTTPYYAFDMPTTYITGGLGYRSGLFSLDAAVTNKTTGEQFFPYYDSTPDSGVKQYADVKLNRLNLAVTAGFRF